jgi:uncharacterized membrane protein
MSKNPSFRAPFALLTILLLLVLSAPAVVAHKAHEAKPPPVAESVPEPSAVPHDHAEHRSAISEPAAAAPDKEPTTIFSWLGRFHPVVVHFPIALLMSTALAERLFIRTRNPLFSDAVRFCIWIGVAGAFAAAPLGWLFAGFRFVDEEWVMIAHRWAGITTFAASLALLWVSERTYRSGSATRLRLRAALATVAALVGLTGFLGGSLLYGIDHYAW